MAPEGSDADHAEGFYLGLALDPAYVEGLVGSFLKRMAKRIRMRSTSSWAFGRMSEASR